MTESIRKCILLVEDEPLLAMTEKKQLEGYGYVVRTITTGEQAVEAVKSSSDIDLIFMDIDLGSGIDGTQAAEIILKDHDIPIVFISSHTEPKIVEKMEKITSYGYVVKNAGVTVLDASIKMALKLFDANNAHNLKEAALRQSEQKLRQVIDLIPHFIFAKDVDGKFLLANAAVAEAHGTTPEELVGKSNYDFSSNTEETDFFLECDRKVIVSETITDSTGARRYLETTKVPFTTSGVEIPAILAVSVDITEKKQVETELAESVQLLSRAQKIAHIGNWHLDLMTNRLWWSDEIYRLFGCKPQEFSATYEAFLDFVHPDDRAAVDDAYTRSMQEGNNGYEIDHRIVRRDSGDVRYVHERCDHERDEAGTVIRSIGMVQDITERKQAENALIESEKRYKSVEKAAELGIWEMGIETGEFFWSDEFFRICGYEPGSIIPNSDTGFSLIHNDDKDRAAQAVTETIDTGKPYNIEKRIVRPDGETRWVHSVGEVKFDENGTAKTLVGSFQDITERKQAENKVQQLLTEKEMLVGEIQHRIKNNINTMTSLLSLQAQTLEEPTAIAALEDARNRLYSLATLYDHLYRTNASEIQEYLRQLVSSEVRLFPRGEHVEIHSEMEECMCASNTLTTLGLIVNELVTNAMKYAFRDHPSPKLTITGVHRDEHYVLTIKDNGPGIPEANERQSASSGFGSMIVTVLIEGLDGTITFKNDNGTQVTLAFPITKEK